MDRGWRESRLPSLTRVLLYSVIVGVSQVSWAVRYLDKPPWRAVIAKALFNSDFPYMRSAVLFLFFSNHIFSKLKYEAGKLKNINILLRYLPEKSSKKDLKYSLHKK